MSAASPWLPLHLALGIASYGLFAAAVVHAWLMTRAEKQIRHAADPQAGVPLLTLERLTFRFVAAGFVLLSATLLAGLLFSETLYGTAGHWQAGTTRRVFSVLAWLVFAVLLLGRARFGWRGRKAVRVLYAGSALLLLAYVGSRFVLEVVLSRPLHEIPARPRRRLRGHLDLAKKPPRRNAVAPLPARQATSRRRPPSDGPLRPLRPSPASRRCNHRPSRRVLQRSPPSSRRREMNPIPTAPLSGVPRNRLRRTAGIASGRGLAKRHEVRAAWGRAK